MDNGEVRTRDQLRELKALKAENERLQVQLAGCGVAALGHGEDVEKGDYGWSQSYQDVLDLRTYFERGIKDDAERAGIDTRGLIGMAIVHTMVEEIERLQERADILTRVDEGIEKDKEIERLRAALKIGRKAIAQVPAIVFGRVEPAHDHPGYWIRDELIDKLTKALGD